MLAATQGIGLAATAFNSDAHIELLYKSQVGDRDGDLWNMTFLSLLYFILFAQLSGFFEHSESVCFGR